MKDSKPTYIATFNFHKVEEVLKPKSGTSWLPFDVDNLYPQRLFDLYNQSSDHQSILSYKADQTQGEGVETSNPAASLMADKWKLNDLHEKLSLDLNLYGGYTLQVRYSNDRSTLTIDYLDYSTARLGAPNSDGEIDTIWICADWKNTTKYKPVPYPIYNPALKESEPIQIYYYKSHTPGLKYYGTPDYSSALGYVDLENQLQKYHLASIKNGFFPSLVISFADTPEENEREFVKNEIEGNFSGATNAGKAIITFSEGKDNMPIITPINASANADMMNAITGLCTQKIVTAHKLTSPELVGITTGGASLGGDANKIATAYSYFFATVIRKKQNRLISTYSELAKECGITNPDFKIINNQPLNYIPQFVMENYMTETEIRDIYGLGPKEIK